VAFRNQPTLAASETLANSSIDMPDNRWQFWIDVGGTFTDCIARRPDGTLLRRKVLSSGVTKGVAGAGSTPAAIVDPARAEPDGFWRGFKLRQLDRGVEAVITDSSAGKVVAPNTLTAGQGYEIISPEEAPILAIRLFLGLRLDEPIPPCDVRLGTTRGTNALLTRQGARTGLVATRGHGDFLHIGYQNRPKLFELAIKKPAPLFAEVAEINERIAADGTVLQPLSAQQANAELTRLQSIGIESLAICLLNAYANPAHELALEQIARDVGFREISVSTRVSPLMKLVPRGDTTVVDAYLNPVLRAYVERLAGSLPGSDVRLMTSAGGLVRAEGFTGKDSILSGPAGGVVGFSRIAEAAGFEKAIGFDMGGTSTDVSRFDGRFEYEYETQKAGVRIVAPMLAIETVAAGGGSICRWDGIKLVVGPESAGADPGPACYGWGGPLTITDCNFYLGRILPEYFPFPLDREAVERRLAEVAEQCRRAGGESLPMALHVDSSGSAIGELTLPARLSAIAEGFVRIANANMAQAIRGISLAKGYDPRDYVLVAFGAAGPQHACAVAAELGIRRILLHPDAGVLSALGMGLADVVKHQSAGVYRLLDDLQPQELAELFERLIAEACRELQADGVGTDRATLVRTLDLRYQGTDASISIAQPPRGDPRGAYRAAFTAEHRRLYGYVHEGRALEVVAARIEAAAPSGLTLARGASATRQPTTIEATLPLWSGGQVWRASVICRDRLLPGSLVHGPAIIVEPLTTTIVEAGWQGEVLTGGEMLLSAIAPREGEAPAQPRLSDSLALPETPDPVLLEVLSNHFTAIATQMGITLRNTATSVNVKERLDFSCAIFTASGDLVVNAPHIPVHLGAMGETVKCIIADNPDMQPGDVFVTNDPYRGGSHLPDVTVVTPVFRTAVQGSKFNVQGQSAATLNVEPGTLNSVLFFTASRAHHAEIGGITPGSMPPFSRNLAEEGVLIRNFKLVGGGIPRMNELRELLSSGRFPSRSPDTNLADITAQLAANQQGVLDLRALMDRYTEPVVLAYMRHIQHAAERKLRTALARLPAGRREFVDFLDDGTPIRVAITIEGNEATIDFTGTGAHRSPHALREELITRSVIPAVCNLNANRAIVTAAVMYVLRLVVGEDIPLNQGVLAPVQIILPECILNPPVRERPEDCAAVVGGNVETSQRVVDVLVQTLKLAADSQGTMNNVLFGDESFGYYETICGGSGATADADGADAVHTHMTNTRLTDPEVLEARYPVRLRGFGIRRGSGGIGQHRGGNGVIRQFEFLRELTLSILSQRRGPYPPGGLNGGQAGSLGQNTLHRTGGTVVDLPGSTQIDVQPGDVLTVETPGGGGWGDPRGVSPAT
jgi:5-oxoprolinase (ATP-hydrolysing)